MKEITFTNEELDSLLLAVNYLIDNEQKHYMESMMDYEEYYNEKEGGLNHIYVHAKKIEQALMKQITNL